eukprot:5885341-Pyramimonas_sp.AAC.1
MRLPYPAQRNVASQGAPPKAPMAALACGSLRPGQRFVARSGASPKAPFAALARGPPTQDSATWPHRELQRRPQWLHTH